VRRDIITEARELFAKTTQGEYISRHRGSEHYEEEEFAAEIGDGVQIEGTAFCVAWCERGDAEFFSYAHNHWQEMLGTIERQRAELGEYWRAACAIESVDDVVSAKGLADLHAIRTGNNYSQVGPSVAEMLVRQRDELAKEVERLKAFEKCVADAMQWAGQTCKEMIESARVELRIKRGEIID